MYQYFQNETLILQVKPTRSVYVDTDTCMCCLHKCVSKYISQKYKRSVKSKK